MTAHSTDAKHTPGPLEFIDGFIMANGEALKVIGIQTPMSVGPSRIEALHNSARIVRAWNAYDDMLAALKAILADCEEYSRINKLHNADGSPATNHAMRQAEDAISKAEGRS